MTKYREILKEAHNAELPGIFFAFNNEQFAEGMKKNGYTSEKELMKTSTGAIGNKEALDNMKKFYENINTRIKSECTPDEIYSYEYHNHECGYTGDDEEALECVREYFPDYTPSRDLKSKLLDESDC